MTRTEIGKWEARRRVSKRERIRMLGGGKEKEKKQKINS
jgi:hypothetical protein